MTSQFAETKTGMWFHIYHSLTANPHTHVANQLSAPPTYQGPTVPPSCFTYKYPLLPYLHAIGSNFYLFIAFVFQSLSLFPS